MKFMRIEGNWVIVKDSSQVKVGDYVQYHGKYTKVIYGDTARNCRKVSEVYGDKARTLFSDNIFDKSRYTKVMVFVPAHKGKKEVK